MANIDPELAQAMGMDVQQNKPSAPQPIGLKERLIATLIFDTQPKRRAAYFERLGYQLNPKNDNEIKPIGADNDQYFPIDPGGIFNFKQYGEKGLKSGVSELGKDALEGALDFLQGTATEAAGSGAALMTAGMTGGAGAVAAPAARAAGRIAMFRAIENFKDSIGDMFLDKDIPVDQSLRSVQTAIQAVGPETMAAAAKGAKSVVTGGFKAVSNGVKNLLDIGDGSISEQAWNEIKKNPKLFTDKEALRSASSEIDSTVEKLLGSGPDGNNINRSYFGDKLASLEAQRKAEVAKLSANPVMQKYAPTKEEVIKLFQDKLLELSDPTKYPIASKMRQDGIEYIQNQIKKLQGFEGKTFGFDQLDSMVKEIQSDLYSPVLNTKDWRLAVKTLVDGNPNDPSKMGLNNFIKDAADKVGSPYGKIKQQESNIFKAYENVSSVLTPQNARRFVLGDDLYNPKGTGTDTVAREVRQALEQTDAVLGSNISAGLRDGQIRNNIFRNMETKGPRGSGGMLTGAAASAIPAYGIARGMGASNEAAMGAAALAGGVGGLLSQPKIGLPFAIGAERLALGTENLAQQLAPQAQALSQPLGIAVTRAATQMPEGEQRPELQAPQSNDEIDPELKALMGL